MKAKILIGAGLILSALGCGAYEPVEILPDHLRSLRVNSVSNETSQIGLGQDLTQQLIDDFVREGRFKVTGSDDADAILFTTIADYSKIPISYDENFVAQEYKITMVVNLQFVDNIDRVRIFDESRKGLVGGIETWVNYNASPDLGFVETEEEAKERLIREISERIIQRTIYGWD
ncbi:MAG: LptE family protein [Elusimicrobia bacterium]|nr:LptE family protein [Elusimicrobiota bacterium]